jgi:excisionase family DNA binding protein
LLYTLAEAAAYLCVSRSTMQRLVSRGVIQGTKRRIEGHPFCKEAWFFTKNELDRFRFDSERLHTKLRGRIPMTGAKRK